MPSLRGDWSHRIHIALAITSHSSSLLLLSSLTSEWHGVHIIVLRYRCMTTDAFVRKGCIFSIWLQIGSSPASPSPAFCRSILLTIADHELHLNKRACLHHTCH